MWQHALLFVGGMATSAVLGLAAKSKAVRDVAVKGTAKCLIAGDKMQEAAQNFKDDAEDIRAEAARQKKIDSLVAERLSQLEDDIRAKATSEVDAACPEA